MRQLTALAAILLLAGCGPKPIDGTSSASGADWPHYHGNPNGTHYSTLAEITPQNVKNLKVAWEFDSGDAFGEGDSQSEMEGNPMVIRGHLYFISPKGKLFCLDAATGKQQWVFDPSFGDAIVTRQRLRGISYWEGDGSNPNRKGRILFTFRGKLIAVDVTTGRLINTFGHNGEVDLREGLGRDYATISVGNVTPGVVYKDLIVMGSTGNTPGHIRAFDVRTGKMRWIFHTIPHPGEYGYESWPKDAWKTAKGANAWSGLTLDPERGLVFVPLASAGMGNKDFYGGDRPGDNLFGTSLVALDANTGKRVWHFQLVKHDLWDRDPPTPPTLITVKGRPAVAQVTKAGLVFILDRETGKPLYPMQDIAVPATDVPGETSSPTQVMPMNPEPFARQHLTEDLLTDRTPEANAAVKKVFAGLRSRGPFDPPSVQGTVLLPGMDGGAEYGGASFDPESGLLYINANEMAWILKVKAQPPRMAGTSGEALYQNTCAACHRDNRTGSPPEFPSLIGVGERLDDQQLTRQITNGAGRMPGFGAQLRASEIANVIGYLKGDPGQKARTAAGDYPSTDNDAYVFDGYVRFLDPDGYPAIKPPWGTLSALDVNTGKYVWKKPLGEYPELADKTTGSENYGGAVVTKGGVLFIAATIRDNKFRAFDKKTGALLWQTQLPASSIATPATYAVKGKQYVVVQAGGGKNPKVKPSGKVIAYSLP